jgi:hypothetical protein
VKSHLTYDFIKCFNDLPDRIKNLARKNYRIWKSNHYHPSLNFKEIKTKSGVYSVRIGIGWRAMGVVTGDFIIWFWIGSRSDYDKIIANL